MDIRDIQRLHEQFAHASLTLEAPTSAHRSGGRMLPPPAYAAAGATRPWAARFGNARLVVSVVVGIVAAGALGMAIGTWQHGRATNAAPPEAAAPAAVQVKPPAEEPAQAPPVSAAEVESAPVSAKAQPVEPAAKVAEPARPAATPAAPVAAPAPRPQPSPAPGVRAAAPVPRKAEPAPALAQASPATPAARRADSAVEIKLF